MISRSASLLLAIALGASGALLPSAARADGGYTACKVGDRVADRDEKTGTVVEIAFKGVDCYVDFGASDAHHYYLFWMLHPAGKPKVDPAQVARILPGTYSCYAGNPLQYQFSDIIIVSATAYRDNKGNAGSFRYAPATQMIDFQSGPFKGAYAKYLAGYNIGLASQPTTFFATVCSLKR